VGNEGGVEEVRLDVTLVCTCADKEMEEVSRVDCCWSPGNSKICLGAEWWCGDDACGRKVLDANLCGA
jgi:hypothetical protein